MIAGAKGGDPRGVGEALILNQILHHLGGIRQGTKVDIEIHAAPMVPPIGRRAKRSRVGSGIACIDDQISIGQPAQVDSGQQERFMNPARIVWTSLIERELLHLRCKWRHEPLQCARIEERIRLVRHFIDRIVLTGRIDRGLELSEG